MSIHWLNWNSETDNVFVSGNSSLCVGSQKYSELYSLDQKLSANVKIAEAIENSPLKIILFKSITELRFVRDATSILVRYQTKNSQESLELELGSKDKAEELFDHISQHIASTMVKRIGDTDQYYGLVLTLCSIFFAAVFMYSFFNIQRLAAYLIPLICVIATLGYVIYLKRSQRLITRWINDLQVKKVSTPVLRAVGACFIFSTLSLAISPLLHENHGERALYSAAKRGSLEANQISGYLDRGSSINYADAGNTNVLWWTIKHSNESAAMNLISRGADVRGCNGCLLEHAIQNQASEALLRPMLRAGALEAAETSGNFDTKHYLKKSDNHFAKAFDWHRTK